MRNVWQLKTWGRGMQLALLAAGVMGLSGCMAGYSYVQPGNTGAGGYYTGDAAYPAYSDGGGYAYGSPYSLSVSIGNGWGPGYYGGYGYGYAYPSYYYRGRRGNWHGGHDHHADHQGGHNWRPSQPGSTPQSSDFAPAPRAYTRPAPSAQQPANRPGAPSVQRR